MVPTLWVRSVVFLFFFAVLLEAVIPAVEVKDLIRQLDADTLKERNAAEAALIQLGASVESQLPEEESLAACPELSQEVIHRLKNVFQELRFQTIQESLKKIKFHLAKAELNAAGRCWVTLQADWPKEVFPIRLLFPMKEVEGTDAANQSITPVSRNAVLEIPVGKNQMFGQLLFAVNGGRPDVVFGNCRVLLALAEKRFEFNRILADSSNSDGSRTLRKGRTTISVESARFFSLKEDVGNESLTIRFRVRFDDAFAALESHRTWIYENETVLKFRSGKSLKPTTLRPVEQGANEIVFDATFDLPSSTVGETPQGELVRRDEIVAFAYTTPTIIVEETIPFRTSD